VQEGDGGHGVALDQIDDMALLVESAVQMLAETVDALTVVRLEVLLDTAVGVHTGSRIPGVRPLLREEFTARGRMGEAEPAVGVGVCGDAAVDQLCSAVGQ
jgi:hypothetical protein